MSQLRAERKESKAKRLNPGSESQTTEDGLGARSQIPEVGLGARSQASDWHLTELLIMECTADRTAAARAEAASRAAAFLSRRLQASSEPWTRAVIRVPSVA